MIVIGILLEVAAAALGTVSKQLIAYSEHVQKRWIFHVGAGINIFVGPVVDASAYAFAPQVVVAPFACLDVIFNALSAPYTLHFQNERLTRNHVWGTGLVALGAVFTAVFGSVHDVILTVEELEAQLTKRLSLAYFAAELGLLLVLTLVPFSAKVRGVCLGVTAGVLMGNTFCMKGFIGIVRTSLEGDAKAWVRPTPYLLVAGAVAGAVLGHIFMRKGLGEYKGIYMVTIYEGAHIIAACLSGCVVMEEMAHAPWWQYVLYWLSVLCIVFGMMLINTAAQDSKMGRSFHTGLAAATDGQVVGTVEAPEPPDQPLVQEGARHRGGQKSNEERPVSGKDFELDKLEGMQGIKVPFRPQVKAFDEANINLDLEAYSFAGKAYGL